MQMLMRRVKRLQPPKRPIEFGTCSEDGCVHDAIVRINNLGVCRRHLEKVVRQQAERAHAAFMRRIEQAS